MRGENVVTIMVSSIHASNLSDSVMAIGKSAAERLWAAVEASRIPPPPTVAATDAATADRQTGARSLLRTTR